MSTQRRLGGVGDEEALRELQLALDDAKLRGPDDVMLRRMWGRVSEPTPPRRRAPRWLWFVSGVASTATLSLMFAAWLWPANTPPVRAARSAPAVPASSGVVDVRPAVVSPGTVRTGAGETLRLTLRGGTEARLGSSAVVRLDEDDRPTVEGGEVAFAVPHQPMGRRFMVQAGGYRVVVFGTKFRLRVEPSDQGEQGADKRKVFVAVDDGVVEIWERGRLARLTPGQTWTNPDAATESRRPAPPARHVRRTVALMTSSPGSEDATADARAALATGEVARALTLYRALAQRSGPAAENAEYEIGRILRDYLGEPGNAITAWRRYRSEHPAGILRVEADVSIIETLVHGGQSEAALTEATDFLRRHPESERRPEIARIAGDLYRTRGDCGRAIGAYQNALSAPRAGGVAEAASFHRASCLVQLRDPAGADAARAYLKEWPSGRFRVEAARLVSVGERTGTEAPRRP